MPDLPPAMNVDQRDFPSIQGPPASPHRAWPRAAGQVVMIVIMICALAVALLAGLHPTMSRANTREPHRASARNRPIHTDHAGMMPGPFPDGPSVTRACVKCHADAARQVQHTAHFTWLGDPAVVPETSAIAGGSHVRSQPGAHSQPQRIGKRNLLNNFCLSIESNWARCTSCHAGYGWEDASFDFSVPDKVDCLVCHDQTGSYRKGLGGMPGPSVNLVSVAASVAAPTRDNCGFCHFAGGGGDAVKHGDLDATLSHASERIDIHMGRYDFVCTDCHRTEKHRIAGRSMSVSVGGGEERVQCSDCHDGAPHRQARLNAHTKALACETCHVPRMAEETPTKLIWDWSTAGRDVPGANPHEYMKEKGSFVYGKQVIPEYDWYDGTVARYLKGDPIDPDRVVSVNLPRGSIGDPRAKIWPFKVHRGKQPYDTVNRYLLIAKTYGEGGFWSDYDWDRALRLGSQAAGLVYSGSYGFVATEMYWPLTHMVKSQDQALQCPDCHGEHGRFDWQKLGYEGDPAYRGGRVRQGLMAASTSEEAP
jgi:octaheme c-type cytochrome (tetrathionate reductase family)